MEVSASRPGLFIPLETARGTHWIGRWADLRASLDAVIKRKSCLYRESNPALYRLSCPDSVSKTYIIQLYLNVPKYVRKKMWKYMF
jgi:hypothetical protein